MLDGDRTLDEIILDTNVFVAAGFNRRSASARILRQVRSGQLRMIWNVSTRNETKQILNEIPPLSWAEVAELFREEDCFHDETCPEAYRDIRDPDDRKYAALSVATGATLLSNDDDLLRNRETAEFEVLTPSEYWQRQQAKPNSP